jgi:hypothetical protein
VLIDRNPNNQPGLRPVSAMIAREPTHQNFVATVTPSRPGVIVVPPPAWVAASRTVNGTMSTTTVVTWPAPDRLGEAMRRSLPRLAPGVRAEVEKLLTPEALAVIAAVLGLWVGSHFIGIGEIIDIILLAVGVLAIGLAVFDGGGELAEFSRTALGAASDQDLDRASIHFANAVSILGIQAASAYAKTHRLESPHINLIPQEVREVDGRLVWTLRTPTIGRWLTVGVDDATGEVVGHHVHGVR